MRTPHETSLTTHDGLRLHVVEHLVSNPLGTVLLVHGMGEHSGCYGHVIEGLNQVGMEVIRYDQRGHGKSTGVRGHTTSYENYLQDLTAIVTRLFQDDPYRLLTIYGHSMGGGVVANWFLRCFQDEFEDRITGAILSAPWFRLATPVADWKVFLIDRFSQVFPQLAMPTSIRGEALTRRKDILRKIQEDSLRHNRITLKAGIECYRAGRWALQNANRFPVPLLAFHGTTDVVTSCSATIEFCQSVPNARFVQLEDFLHEPHNDLRWREILNHSIDFLEKRFPRAIAA